MRSVAAFSVSPVLPFINFLVTLKSISVILVISSSAGILENPLAWRSNFFFFFKLCIKISRAKQFLGPLGPNQILSHKSECVIGCTATVPMAAAEAVAR